MTKPVAKAKDWAQKWNFVVEIDGFQDTGFETCSPIESSGEVIERREGGAIHPVKEPGQGGGFENVTLTRGATTNREAYEWFDEVYPVDGQAVANEQVKKTVRIIQYNRDGSEKEVWQLFGAFPVRFSSGDWDANANEHRIEELELAFDYAKVE